uniref:Uncharacterized protein n=1 Tax=Arundo donax TaxID=35708 RepID=A0A0A9H0M8_ARUDO
MPAPPYQVAGCNAYLVGKVVQPLQSVLNLFE